MADQRKERRAPASLKVKYKSATVDQFVEQFGGDVSTGGMFIKTKTPLEIGALLKLELQLSDASPVIQGVGRVCWRRVPNDASPLPPGMGIKFQRLEDASRATVERIVSARGGTGSRFDQTEGAEVGELADSPLEASLPPAGPIVSAKPAPPAPPPKTARPAGPPSTASLPAAGARPTAGAKPPAAPPPRAPATSGVPKPIPSINAAANAAGSAGRAGPASPVTSRAPVAGLFSDSPMARATPEPAAPRTRSSFFPAAPNTNGNAPPPAPAGISSRPPPAPVARNVATSAAPRVAGAFGGTRLAPPPAPAPTRAEEEDAIDRLFEEVVQPRSSMPPPSTAREPAAPMAAAPSAFGEAAAADDHGLFAEEEAPPPPPEGSFGDWSASSSATTSLHTPARSDAPDEGELPDFGDEQFGDEVGNSGAPGSAAEAAPVLSLPSLSQPAPAARGSSLWPWLLIAVVVLGAGGFIYMQRSAKAPPTEPAPTAVPAASPPATASAAGAPAAPAAPSAEPVAGAAAPAGEQPAAAAPSAEPVAPAAPSAEPAAPAQMVAVEVTALPRGAEILVDGKPVGTAPMRVSVPLGVAVELSVRSAGYAPASKTLTASAKPEPERFKLAPLPYSVTVRTDPPGAELSAEGRSATAPGPLELGHLDGTATLSVAKSGYQRVTRPLRLEEFIEQDGQMRAEVEVRLSPLPSGGSRRREREREAPPAPAPPAAAEPAAPAAPEEGSTAPAAPPVEAPGAQGSTGTVTPIPEPKPEAAAPSAVGTVPSAPPPPPALPQ